VPLEQLTLEQFRALPAPDDAPYLRSGDAVSWWANHTRGFAGVVWNDGGSWGYGLLGGDDDRVYRACGLGTGFESLAHATAELHRRMDDPPHTPLARSLDDPA
jgi:hypothetical protein